MNPAFVARLTEWQPFCAALASASATFAGLLFVSLSVHPVLLGGKDKSADRLAHHTFGCFIFLVLTALIVMIPGQGPLGIGIPLFGLGLRGVLHAVRARRDATAAPSVRIPRDQAFYLLSTATYVTGMGVAVAIIYGYDRSIYALVALMLWQLAWGTRLAWDLLMVRD